MVRSDIIYLKICYKDLYFWLKIFSRGDDGRKEKLFIENNLTNPQCSAKYLFVVTENWYRDMANRIRSAKKKHRQSLKRSERNTNVRSRLKSITKRLVSEIDNEELDKSRGTLTTLISSFDRAAQKGIIHKKTASRNISNYSLKVHNLSKKLESSS